MANADAEGKINIVKMTDHHTRKGFAVGAVAGVVVGIIFPPSIIASALVVGAGGAAIGKLGNLNARNATARDLASVLTPGSSGIIAAREARRRSTPSRRSSPSAEEVKAAPVSDEAAAAVKDAAKAAGPSPPETLPTGGGSRRRPSARRRRSALDGARGRRARHGVRLGRVR